ncbi:3'-5' DNA helicase [Coemansia interrupta]|uniref:DNA helicase n=1 Tax=Coemansia interrupta TaxID=1126814 RepID=A0A9W8H736_9FUNG|nr:3'-5' DNA helicase [Coemansia interrupta]
MDDDFVDLDLDNLDDGMLEELLKDDLDMADPIVVPDSPTPTPTAARHPVSSLASALPASHASGVTGGILGFPNAQQSRMPNASTRAFSRSGSSNGVQKHNAQKPHQKGGAPSLRPGQMTIDAMFGKRIQRRDFEEQKMQDELDAFIIDSDCDDLIAEVTPQKQETYAKHPTQSSDFSPFQAKQLVVRNRGDNRLVERLHEMNLSAMKTYVYPLLNGQPARAYQQGAIQRCLFQNTLVALPTGMGKTLIAVVVMANYARWFPNSLSVFLAPTKPLVSQQMQACRGMIQAILRHADDAPRLEENWIVEMNGSTQPKVREKLWASARFVFSTPQILQNDIKSGILTAENAKRITLLVIDEAHRATGKYAYGVSVGLLYKLHHSHDLPMYNAQHPSSPGPFRVMSLTATPGSHMEAVKEIVTQLHVSHIFIRTEESMDVVPYIHGRRIEEMVIDMPPWLVAARNTLADVLRRSANLLSNGCNAMKMPADMLRLSGYMVRMDRDRFCQHMGGNRSGLDTPRIIAEFTILISLAHIMQLLSEHGLRPAWNAIHQWDQEVQRAKENNGTATRAKVDCVDSKEWGVLIKEFRALVDALDGKPVVPSGSGADTAASSSRLSGNAAAAKATKTDLVSSFFNVSNKPPKSAVGTPMVSGATQTAASLAHTGFLGHPKLERMVEVVSEHFSKLADSDSAQSTRIIIFSQYRGSVSEIVGVLHRKCPLVRCEPFIGQSKSAGASGQKDMSEANSGSPSRGRGGGWRGGYGRGAFGRGRGGYGRGGFNRGGFSRGGGRSHVQPASNADDGIDELLLGFDSNDPAIHGQSQKEQLAVLNRFRQGETNVIVATCVGEEGLDIGEVDLIINYDAPSSPIRLLQRIGRTGRARRGKVVVFLAKDTREENSYKKAQRDYKNVQAKIASGRELFLRTDISPPMLPPSLPNGQPERREIHLTRDEISRVDAEAASASTGKRTRTRKSHDNGPSVGVSPQDMNEYWRLKSKYDIFSGSGVASNAFRSAVSIVDRARAQIDSAIPGRESEAVARLLRRGLAWQSLESPHVRIRHSQRSTMYRRIMAGLEQARFSIGTDDGGSHAGAGKSLFRLEGEQNSVSYSSAYKTELAATRSNVARPPRGKGSVPQPIRSVPSMPVSLDGDKGSIDDYDDSLDDIDTILGAKRDSNGARINGFDNRDSDDGGVDFTIPIGSSPLLDDFLFPAARPSVSGAAASLASKAVSAGNENRGSHAPSTQKRRQSLQGNLFAAMDRMMRSGKVKRTFDWSIETLDLPLVEQARIAGVDIGLVAPPNDIAPESSVIVNSPTRPSIFDDIGQPGVFDKLFEENLPPVASNLELSSPLSVAALIKNTHGSPVPVTEEARQIQLLCAESDTDEAMLDDGWNISSLADLKVSSPPTQPVPESPPADESSHPLAKATREPDASQSRVLSVTPQVVEVIDDDDLEAALLGFDMDCDDILVLSDDDGDASFRSGIENTVASKRPTDPAAPDVAFLNGTALISAANSRHTSNEDLMSSSPLKPRVRLPAGMRSMDTASNLNSAASQITTPVRKPVSRLLRGCRPGIKPADRATTAISPASVPTSTGLLESPVSKPAKQRKKLRAPPRRQCMPNPFVDAEADIGDSGDEENDCNGNARRKPVVSDDEADGDDLDQDLSSFIVDDDQVEFDTPQSAERRSHDHDEDTTTEITPRRIGDVYRRSLHTETTPVSVILQQLAEREKQRRWVYDTPTKTGGGYRQFTGFGDDDIVDDDLDDQNGQEHRDGRDDMDVDGSIRGSSDDESSDFEGVEKLFD